MAKELRFGAEARALLLAGVDQLAEGGRVTLHTRTYPLDAAAEAFADLDGDVRQSIARIKASPFLPHTSAVRGFVFDVDTGLLREVR